MTDFESHLRAELDRFTVPPIGAGFAAKVCAATAAQPIPRRHSGRGWHRRGRILIGAGALLLASATATATGIFGALPDRLSNLAKVFVAAPTTLARLPPTRNVVGKVAAIKPPAGFPPTPRDATIHRPALVEETANRGALRRARAEHLLSIRTQRIAARLPVRPLVEIIARHRVFLANHPAVAAWIARHAATMREEDLILAARQWLERRRRYRDRDRANESPLVAPPPEPSIDLGQAPGDTGSGADASPGAAEGFQPVAR